MDIVRKCHAGPSPAAKTKVASNPQCIHFYLRGGLKDVCEQCRSLSWRIVEVMD
jgi:hypothetical protein